jgi:TolB-like protein/Tfp pilus assembly protein PilF
MSTPERPAPPPVFRFGTFELDVRAGELRRGGRRIHLQEQPLRILEMLLANPGELVTREELRSRLWAANSFVDFDHGLNKAINKLREALGDSAENPRFIETLAKRGYRFLGEAQRERSEIRTLLVLPFDNLSGDPEQDYFAIGLTEALTTKLTKVGALKIISRATAMYYKQLHRPIPELARDLGFEGVIDGSVLRSQDRVRIHAQLVDAPTDTQLWAESYDRDVRDILALQAEVAAAIVSEIRVQVTPQERAQLERTPRIDVQAYEACLRGRYHWARRTPAGYRRAIEAFEQAILREPRFAAAYAGLADCYNLRGWYGVAPPASGCGRAKELAQRALELDPGVAESHAALGWALQHFDYDSAAAEAAYRQAIALDPRCMVAHYRLSMALSWTGRHEQAIAEAQQAMALDPVAANPAPFLSMAYLCAGQYELMAAHGRRATELHPEFPVSHWALGWACLEMGEHSEALAALTRAVECADGATLFQALLAEGEAVAGESQRARGRLAELLANAQHAYVMPYVVARIQLALGDRDEAFRWLTSAYEERAAWVPFLSADPRLAPLREDARFAALVRRVGLPRAAGAAASTH